MKQRTLAMMTGFEQYTSKTPASHISGGDGAGGAVGRVVRAGGAALSPAWEGAAAGGSRAHAADLLFAAVVQPVGPGGGRGAVRLRGGCGSSWALIWAVSRCRTRPRCASSGTC